MGQRADWEKKLCSSWVHPRLQQTPIGVSFTAVNVVKDQALVIIA
jgi:hypothetical protein